MSPEEFAGLAPPAPPTPVVALARRPPADPAAILAAPGPGPVVLLDRPNHLGNLGAVVRVAAAAGAAGVLTTGERDPWHPTALRGSAGLHFALPVARLAGPLPAGRPLVAARPGGRAAVGKLRSPPAPSSPSAGSASAWTRPSSPPRTCGSASPWSRACPA